MPSAQPIEERFWTKVQKADGDQCWNWIAGCDSHGYGNVKATAGGVRKVLRAHRVAWELTHGPIPNGLHLLHRCDNPRCVRPDHLSLGTNNDNVADRVTRGRQTRKLSDAQVVEIRRRRQAGEKPAALAGAFGVSAQTITAIMAGRSRADAQSAQTPWTS